MQAGINIITLYENKNLSFRFHDEDDRDNISALTTDGDTVELENCQQPAFTFETVTNNNNRIMFAYNLEYYIFELTIETIEAIQQVKESIYGWCPLIQYYDGTRKFYNVPFFCRENSPINIQESMAFGMILAPNVNTVKRHYNYYTVEDLGFKADTTLITADSTLYTADYEY